jgi:hypothetical protein
MGSETPTNLPVAGPFRWGSIARCKVCWMHLADVFADGRPSLPRRYYAGAFPAAQPSRRRLSAAAYVSPKVEAIFSEHVGNEDAAPHPVRRATVGERTTSPQCGRLWKRGGRLENCSHGTASEVEEDGPLAKISH